MSVVWAATGRIHRAAKWPWGNICLPGCGRRRDRVGIHMGIKPVMREACERMGNKLVTLLRGVDGDRTWIKYAYVTMMRESQWDSGSLKNVLCLLRNDSWAMFLLPHPNCERQNSVMSLTLLMQTSCVTSWAALDFSVKYVYKHILPSSPTVLTNESPSLN